MVRQPVRITDTVYNCAFGDCLAPIMGLLVLEEKGTIEAVRLLDYRVKRDDPESECFKKQLVSFCPYISLCICKNCDLEANT